MSDLFLMEPENTGVNMLRDGSARDAFNYWLEKWSDIQDHLRFLFARAHGNILELGVRGGISTSAFLAGVEAKGGRVLSIDIDSSCSHAFAGHPQWDFYHGSSMDYVGIAERYATMMPFDVIFIDTDHSYNHLKQELIIWSPFVKPGGFILMHDVLTFPAMALAIDEFIDEKKLSYRIYPGSNGLGVITV